VVSDSQLRKLLLDAAILATRDPAYLPIFVRLQTEVDARQAKMNALEKAKSLVAAQNRPCPPNVTFWRPTG
jgi:hypothetical protein